MYTLNCKGRLLVIDQPVVMGILNLTPDSFYSGSRHPDPDDVLLQAERMIRDGATILDIGGQSTRPGSARITEEEELERVIGSIATISQNFPGVYISIDSFYARVAREAVNAGACIVNDISAGSIDPYMISTVATLNVPYVLMHMKGTPQTMPGQAHYENVTREVLDFLSQKMITVRSAGITDIIIDPGFGFAKTISHNFELLKNLEVFNILDAPLLLGLSRKSMVYKTLNITAEEALNGSIVLQTMGISKGASIIRTHDVKETLQAITLLQKMA